MNMSVCVCVRNKNLETHQHISQKGCICIFSMPVGHYDLNIILFWPCQSSMLRLVVCIKTLQVLMKYEWTTS